ncbi:hypothetical protein GGE23_003857 [Rhizobium leguminosarum]|nr:hypothetical protein [Rhizobium leguminosarum]MBB4433705.1 hypothetical protein [Rhizobium esperanzae]MBB4309527.1 hypothetical protein [Rhizobium leguminosarum]MBB4418964.1 hypothetical protein [Rhizobium leguminosarum]MBB4543310.1 hypothetical protein [Rhizobium leguminosarum]
MNWRIADAKLLMPRHRRTMNLENSFCEIHRSTPIIVSFVTVPVLSARGLSPTILAHRDAV